MSTAKDSFSTLGTRPSFGFGDRIGLATAGHVRAIQQEGQGIAPIFAQQSIREMSRTRRSPVDVIADALSGIQQAGWTDISGADADHLKTVDDVDLTTEAGFKFFTIDPSDHVDQDADTYDLPALKLRFEAVRDQLGWWDHYLNQSATLPTGKEVSFDEATCMRCAVKYGAAINFAIALADHIRRRNEDRGTDYEIELSVDETEQPTTLAEHYIIAEQCLDKGVKLVSLAPRFIGDFEKGVDYIGDVSALERSLEDHAAIAQRLGPYKLSLHSGSDKLSIYSAFARATKGWFHVKTAGTSYLEALRVAAICDSDLFREICEFGRTHYKTDKRSYHVHATLDSVPPPAELADDENLQSIYLERWESVPEGKGFTESGRQILHCTFGTVLTDDTLGPQLLDCLQQHQDVYHELLCEHFSRHLRALQQGLDP